MEQKWERFKFVLMAAKEPRKQQMKWSKIEKKIGKNI